MASMLEAHEESILGRQLAMNRQTWVALEKHGLTEGRRLRLDFSYHPPNREAANALCALFREQTDYDVEIGSSGSILWRKWRVAGSTQETAVSPEILDPWVTWMVTAGSEHSCDFDGWGTSI